jgi:hypothetical protein
MPINMITNGVHHDCTFWGISFPFGAFALDFATIDVIEKYLKIRWHATARFAF